MLPKPEGGGHHEAEIRPIGAEGSLCGSSDTDTWGWGLSWPSSTMPAVISGCRRIPEARHRGGRPASAAASASLPVPEVNQRYCRMLVPIGSKRETQVAGDDAGGGLNGPATQA